MPQISIVNVKSLMEKVRWQAVNDVSKTAELYERTGFWLILQIFHYFGFRLQENSRSHPCMNRIHIGLFLSLTLMAFTATWCLVSNFVWKIDGSLDLENAGFFALTSFSYILTILNFSISVANARKYSSFFRSVSSAVNRIPNLYKKQNTIRSIRRSSYFCLIIILFGILIAILTTLYQMKLCLEASSKPIPYILPVISSVLNIVWMATIANFYFFSNGFLFMVCKVLNALIDIYLNPKKNKKNAVYDAWIEPEERIDEEMNEKLANHRKLSVLVKQANSIFSHLMLISLAMEITLCISFIKLLSIKNGIFSFGAYTNIIQVMLMISKAITCANVNDKLKLSLQLNKLPRSGHLFEEQVIYFLYQTNQQINKAEITYGNIFPVTKTFIFTIAGTVLTYALVLQGV